MLLFTGLAPLVVLATGVVADSPHGRDSLVTVPISKRIDSNGIPDLTKRDPGQFNLPLRNTGFYYLATIGVGEPATYHQLGVHSKTAITWVGAIRPFVKTKSSVNTSISVKISDRYPYFAGDIYNDTVTIPDGATISRQYIGVSSDMVSNPDNWDGFLGIGPNDLTLGHLSPDDKMITPTITDTLFHQGKITKNLVAVSLVPLVLTPDVNGELTFGGVDHSKYIGEINFFSPAKYAPANTYWSVDATFRYGNTTILNLNDAPGVFDTGSTRLGLATEAYNQYVQATGAVYDNSTGYLSITPDQYKKLESLYFKIEDSTYELNANAQIWPRKLNYYLQGSPDRVYLLVDDLGTEFSNEVGFVFGSRVLERFYAVFEGGSHCIGLANTEFTNSMTIN